MPDPKLKEAMAEIMGVLKKHDIAGQVTLVSQTHAEFRFRLDPTWSCAKIEEHEKGATVRFKVKKAEIPNNEERLKLAGETAHILFAIRDLCGQNAAMFNSLTEQLSEVMDIDHTPFQGYEPHMEN